MALTSGVLYAHEDVRITTTMVTIGEAHYPVSGIGSVRVTSAPRNRSWRWACGAVIALLTAPSLLRFLLAVVGLDGGAALHGLFRAVVFLLAVGVVARRVADRDVHVHTLWLRDGAREVAALASPHLELVGDVADAISRAVHARR